MNCPNEEVYRQMNYPVLMDTSAQQLGVFGLLLAMNENINSLGALVGQNLNIPHIEVPTSISLIVIFGVLMLSMLLSFIVTKHEQA